MALLSFTGGVAGALSISQLDRAVLEISAPILLIAVAAYFALCPKLGERERKQRITTLCFTLVVAPPLVSTTVFLVQVPARFSWSPSPFCWAST
ncbi:hypothetical protein PMI38_01555 [Pseudomonas sp. GM84]|nr:hypothetical protein PMI38_01555 [Pseudomonas sp. GM84]